MKKDENFIEVLVEQYKNEVQEILIECEQDKGKTVDISLFNKKLGQVWNSAKIDGLGEIEFYGLLTDVVPQLMNQIELTNSMKYKKVA